MRHAELEWRAQCIAAREMIIIRTPAKKKQISFVRRILTVMGL